MNQTKPCLALAFVLAMGSSTWLVAQSPSADRFLAQVAAHPVGDQAERDQSAEIYLAFNVATPSEIAGVLPTVLQYTRVGSEVHARRYAVQFLSAIAIRTDGAQLLASGSQQISSLILDADPRIQHAALAIADYVIANPATNSKFYVAALKTALQNSTTPQDLAVGMVGR